MVITRQGDGRKGTRRSSGRRKGDIQKIIIEGKREKGQEVTVRHAAIPEKRAISVWSWYEEFAMEWSETFIVKKLKKIHKKGE